MKIDANNDTEKTSVTEELTTDTIQTQHAKKRKLSTEATDDKSMDISREQLTASAIPMPSKRIVLSKAEQLKAQIALLQRQLEAESEATKESLPEALPAGEVVTEHVPEAPAVEAITEQKLEVPVVKAMTEHNLDAPAAEPITEHNLEVRAKAPIVTGQVVAAFPLVEAAAPQVVQENQKTIPATALETAKTEQAALATPITTTLAEVTTTPVRKILEAKKIPISESLDRLNRQYGRSLGDKRVAMEKIIEFYSNLTLNMYYEFFLAEERKNFADGPEKIAEGLRKLFNEDILPRQRRLLLNYRTNPEVKADLPEGLQKSSSLRALETLFSIAKTGNTVKYPQTELTVLTAFLLIWAAIADTENLIVTPQTPAKIVQGAIRRKYWIAALSSETGDYSCIGKMIASIENYHKIFKASDAAAGGDDKISVKLSLVKDIYNNAYALLQKTQKYLIIDNIARKFLFPDEKSSENILDAFFYHEVLFNKFCATVAGNKKTPQQIKTQTKDAFNRIKFTMETFPALFQDVTLRTEELLRGPTTAMDEEEKDDDFFMTLDISDQPDESFDQKADDFMQTPKSNMHRTTRQNPLPPMGTLTWEQYPQQHQRGTLPRRPLTTFPERTVGRGARRDFSMGATPPTFPRSHAFTPTLQTTKPPSTFPVYRPHRPTAPAGLPSQTFTHATTLSPHVPTKFADLPPFPGQTTTPGFPPFPGQTTTPTFPPAPNFVQTGTNPFPGFPSPPSAYNMQALSTFLKRNNITVGHTDTPPPPHTPAFTQPRFEDTTQPRMFQMPTESEPVPPKKTVDQTLVAQDGVKNNGK